jgi:hypothetical protein
MVSLHALVVPIPHALIMPVIAISSRAFAIAASSEAVSVCPDACSYCQGSSRYHQNSCDCQYFFDGYLLGCFVVTIKAITMPFEALFLFPTLKIRLVYIFSLLPPCLYLRQL